MNRGMQEHRMAHWLAGLVAALLVLFATPSPAQTAVESVPPKSGGTVWRTSWKGGSFPSAVAACSALSPSDCPICGSLSFVGTKPNPAYPDYMDCVVFYNPGDGTPGWNTLAGTAIPRSNAVCPDPTVNPTVSYQYKVSSGMCEREAPCLVPNAINPRTGQCEPSQKLTITLSGDNEVEPSDASSPKTLPFRATVIDQNTNQPPQNPVTVKIALKVDPTSGGHDHGDSTRPRGGIAEKENCPTDGECWWDNTSNGAVVFNFNVPEVSGTHTITATCEGCTNNPQTAEVKVKVNGLKPIPSFPFYALNETNGDVIGARMRWHTNNHNLAPVAALKFVQIATAYRFLPQFKVVDKNTGRKDFPPVLHINDASLPWGGVYDICARPGACPKRGIIAWKKPHIGHRRGTVVDVRANGADGSIPASNKFAFVRLLRKNQTPYLHEDENTSNEHFHLMLSGTQE